MKKFLALILIVCLICYTVGCTAVPVETEPANTLATEPVASEPVSSETAPTEPPEQATMFSVSMPIIEREEYHEDGTKLFAKTFQEMILILPDPDVASKITIHYLNSLDIHDRDADNILASAQSDYTGQSNWVSYSSTTLYDAKRIDCNVLSLHGAYSIFSGTAHPTHIAQSLNYNLITGDDLSLDEILTEGATMDQILQLLTEHLNGIQEEKQLYPDFPEIISDLLGFGDFSNWYFNNEGLCFCFSPYDIAPYASGIIEVTVPYTQLQGILDDTYFPIEWAYEGTVTVQPFSAELAEQFTQSSEINLLDNGAKVLFHSENTAVSNVSVVYGEFSDYDQEQFVPKATIFASATLTPGDAFVLEADLTHTDYVLLLCYQSGTEIVRQYIYQNDETNSIDLIA